MNFLEIYLLFWIFSFIGWIIEVTVCSIEAKKIVNRGFLLGPYCPIYGFGGVTMLLLMPYKDDPLACFVLALVMCSIIEYITGYLMEKIFKLRWWDYSNEPFNINGRVCLQNAVAFGLLGMLCTSYIYPFLFNVLDKLSYNIIVIFSTLVMVITLIDVIVSFNAMNGIKKIISNNITEWKNKDATNDIKELIKNALSKNNYLQRRLVKAFNYFSCQREEFFCKIDNLKNKMKKNNQIITLYATICAVISTIVLGFMTKNYKLWFTILVPLGFFTDIIIYYFRRKYDN